MGTGHLHAKVLFPAIGSVVLACVFTGTASADDNVRVVPLCSDDRGNQAWVEIDSAGDRMKATPFVAVRDEGLRKVLENPDEKEALAIPVPRLMRLVERARQALRNLKRPGAKPPAGPDAAKAAAAQPAAPVAEPRETAPRPAVPFGPPETTGAAIHPPAAQFSAASR